MKPLVDLGMFYEKKSGSKLPLLSDSSKEGLQRHRQALEKWLWADASLPQHTVREAELGTAWGQHQSPSSHVPAPAWGQGAHPTSLPLSRGRTSPSGLVPPLPWGDRDSPLRALCCRDGDMP